MSLRYMAPAKVNLTLEVLGRRDDGFHEIRSVMQAVSLADVLTFDSAPDGALTLAGGSAEAPPDEDNLVLRAARALQSATGATAGARMTLEKRIPTGAGLGGGSSDAAATLLGLDRLWGLSLPADALHDIAATLGSDVPFFLTGRTALAEGRGERLTPTPPIAGLWLVLAKPAESLPTASVYRSYAAGPKPEAGDETDRLVQALTAGTASLETVAACLRNDLYAPARTLCQGVGVVLSLLRSIGAVAAQMSGSGSACFGLCRNRAEAESAAEAARRAGFWAAAVQTVALPMEET